MAIGDVDTTERKYILSKGKTGFVAVVVFIVVIIVSFFVFVYASHQGSPMNDSGENNPPANDSLTNTPIIFTVRSNSSSQIFTIAVQINLTDGMDQDEAVIVATKVFNVTVTAQYAVKSVSVDDQFVWTVGFHWGYQGEPLGHWFRAAINPIDRTIVYDRCR